jgi:predicted outer membrane repeat protein
MIFKKKILKILIVIFVLLLGINTVSAEGNFTDLQNTIDNNQNNVDLDKDYTFNNNVDTAYVDGVTVNYDNYVLDGKGYTINGNNEARIFQITGENVTIKNVNLINGKTTNNGGAIYTQTNNLKIINTTFTNNVANFGGAIRANDVTVTGSNFIDNTVNQNGGAIFAAGNVTVIGSNFTDNTAQDRGGAINANNVTVIGSNFTGNTAQDGGAIYENNNVKVTGSNFTNNIARRWGGAIIALNVNVTGSNFTGNTAQEYGGAIRANNVKVTGSNFTDNTAQDGGAIYTLDVNVTGSNFTGNTATYSGGGAIRANNANVTGSNFTGNTATYWGGGAIYAGNVNVTGSNFTGNTATYWGGAINAGNVNVTGSNFTGNTAQEYGGAINAINANVTGSNFINNTANDRGGAIYTGNVNVTGSNFTNNTANYGGAIYTGNVNVTGSNFTNNTAQEYGGAINAYNDVNVIGSNFTNNIANQAGGAINANNDVNVIGSNFTNNTANYGGGAIRANNVNVTGSNFTNNTANYDGGAINANNNVNVASSNFTNNTAQEYGGAINANYYINVAGSNFINNTANEGGAINAYNDVNVIGSNFTNNIAKDGGAIRADNVNVTGSNFTNNTAQEYGGAIRADNVNVTGSNFTNNSATNWGGAIDAVDVNVTGSTFINNSANDGGAIDTDNVNITSSTFINNSANDGGAIYAGNVNVTGSNFTGNTATNWGGAIGAGNVNVTGSTFINNSANYGGAIYNYNGVVSGSSFNSNDAIYGVVIFNQDQLNLINNDFNSSNIGYLIYNNGSLFLENNTMFNSLNKAKIYNNDTINSIVYLNIMGNSTLYAVYNVSVILNATLTDDMSNIIVGQNITLKNNILGFINLSNYINGIYQINYTPNSVGSYIINGSYNGGNNLTINTGILTVQSTPLLNVTVDNVVYGEDVVVYVNLTGINGVGLNGTVIITVNGKNYNVTITNGKGNIIIDKLPANTYTLNATYSGSQNYTSTNDTVQFEVSKANSSINVTVDNVVYGEDIVVYVNLTSNGVGLNETVIITVNGKNYTVTITNGKGNIIIDKLPANTYTLNATYNGSQNYTKTNDTVQFEVSKANSSINVTVDNVVYGEDLIIDFNVTNGVSGNVTVIIKNIDDDIVYEKTYNLTDNIIITGLDAGNYTLIVSYNGDSNHIGSNNTTTFVVDKIDTIIDADNIIMFYRDGTRYIAILTDINGNPLANQTIYITVNGVTYTKVTNENGTAYLTINLIPGDYIVGAYFNGTNNYGNATLNTNLTVFSTIISKDLVKYYRNESQYHVTIVDKNGNPLANVTVSFNINGVFYTRTTNNSGVATLNINLLPGDYIVTVNYDDLNISNNVTVLSTISGEDIVKYYKNDTQYHVTVLDGQGNPLANSTVSFNINGVFYTRTTDSNGVATLSINLNPGDYIITATGTDGLKVSNSIKVLSTIIGEDIVKDYKNDTQYHVTVLDGQGNPLANSTVSFNINGVFYTRITDSNGVATLSINLNPGDYIITATGADSLKVSNSIKVL